MQIHVINRDRTASFYKLVTNLFFIDSSEYHGMSVLMIRTENLSGHSYIFANSMNFFDLNCLAKFDLARKMVNLIWPDKWSVWPENVL